MASDSKARTNKHSTVSFTLPISCQICLGKVKQPVLCPNNHVFCQLCLEIWLQRNNQCPTCRVQISEQNPVKHIIGGQIDEDENPGIKSSPNLRRARFDLLYQEYEDQFEKLRKEIIVLRTENNILLAQLQDAEDKNSKASAKDHSTQHGQKSSSHENEIASLLTLNKNLQEAQKLYSELKSEMTHTKSENGKLKDENVSLTRENENLRLELAQRSPKKFGRYTVATLETKISEQEKEINQLKKALERSDRYIEELEDKVSHQTVNVLIRADHKKTEQRHGEANKFQINLEPKKTYTDSASVAKETGAKPPTSADHTVSRPQHPVDPTKKLLFGKYYVDEKTTTKSNPGTSAHSTSAHTGQPASKKAPPHKAHEPHYHENYHSSSREVFKDAHVQHKDEGESKDRTPKKVHFSELNPKPKNGSFDLELPSPMDKEHSHQSSHKPHSSSHAKMSDSEFEDKISQLLEDYSTSPSALARKANVNSDHKKKSDKNYMTSIKNEPEKHRDYNAQNANDSSHLSLPDLSSSASDQFPVYIKKEPVDLDYSMTPELTDCLELMTRAERNIVSLPGESSTAPSSGQTTQHPHSLPRPSSVPPLVPSLNGKISPVVRSMSEISQGSRSSWEHQFYTSLRSNPYDTAGGTNTHTPGINFKQEPADTYLNVKQEPTDTYLSVKQEPIDTYPNSQVNNTNVERRILYSLDLDAVRNLGTKSKGDFNFSAPIKVGPTTSSGHLPQHTFSFTDPIQLLPPGSRGLPNPFSFSHTDLPSSNYSSILNSNAHHAYTLPSSTSLLYSSIPNLSTQDLLSRQSHRHLKPISQNDEYSQASKTNHSNTMLKNVLSSSLNSSELEWPESSPPHPRQYGTTTGGSRRPNGTVFSKDALSAELSVPATSGKHNYSLDTLDMSDASSIAPEPKRRLFETDDDLDFSLGSKTSKR
ncbi:uncharacterized protein LOC131942085 [Physella acuta]|uniref:uncharacterized protein LOC131942085 n=1 Tax=Physella acuta TaxID=109671 RepID=UPI0027DC7ED1|nr:uncharacterized protein LOC131942085 [Physella acuta]